jgi:hypothetical protein
MAGIFAYALAGAADGAGKGLVAQALAAKDERSAEIKFAREQSAAKDQRDFTAGENDLNRTQQTSEREAGQEFTAGQNDANNAAAAGRQTAASRLAIELETLRNVNSTAATDAANARQDVIRGEDKLTAEELRIEKRFFEGLEVEDQRRYALMTTEQQQAFQKSEREGGEAASTAAAAQRAKDAADAAKTAAGVATEAAGVRTDVAIDAAAVGAGNAADAAKALTDAAAARQGSALASQEGQGVLNRAQQKLLADEGAAARLNEFTLGSAADVARQDKGITADATAQTERLNASMAQLEMQIANGGEMVRTNDGTIGVLIGNKVTAVTGPDGEPIKMPSSRDEKLFLSVFASTMAGTANSGEPPAIQVQLALDAAAKATGEAPAQGQAPDGGGGSPVPMGADGVPEPTTRAERDSLPPGTTYRYQGQLHKVGEKAK